jgi:enoyl-CoA hydratase/carnithine racemase
MSDVLKWELRDQVAWVTLNRPEKANALNAELWERIGTCFQELARTPEVRACVLEGAGKHFCAGIDFSMLQQISALQQESCPGRLREQLFAQILEMQEAFTRIEECPKPVIASVQGGCIGAGLDLVAACDLIHCTRDARFQIKEIDLAIAADIGSLQRLQPCLPQGRLRELAYTGEAFSGVQACEWGLANAAHADEAALGEAVTRLACTLARKPPLALRGTKQSLLYSRDHTVSEGLRHIALRNAAMLFSDDLNQAVQALQSGTPPEFRD